MKQNVMKATKITSALSCCLASQGSENLPVLDMSAIVSKDI